MNMILHDFPTANILNGNTLASPKFKNGENLRTYNFVVANPPFSDKTWSTGLTPATDPYQRFEWGEPPAKQGDYGLPAAHHPLDEKRRQSGLYSPARRTVSWQCRGGYP